MTLIKTFFPTLRELDQYLVTKNYHTQGIESLKVIIKVGYLNDLLAEPRAVPIGELSTHTFPIWRNLICEQS